MLFTIGLLLLLAPFPSFQATIGVKIDSTGSNVIKADDVITPSKPKTAAALTKHTVPKLTTLNQTTPAISQKPSAVNTTVTAKRKLSPAVTQTTPPPAVKATASSGSLTHKDKPTASVNLTAQSKTFSTSDVKNSKNKPVSGQLQNVPTTTAAKAGKASGAAENKDKVPASASQTTETKTQLSSSRINKDKLKPLVNQTVSGKPPSVAEKKNIKHKPAPTVAPDLPSNHTTTARTLSASEVKANKDKPASSPAPDVPSTPTKSAIAGFIKNIKDKISPSSNKTSSVTSPSVSDARDKDKPGSDSPSSPRGHTPTGAPDVHSTSAKTPKTPASGTKTNKDKHQPSTKETVSVSQEKTNKDKPKPTESPDVQSTPAKTPLSSGPKTDKNKHQPSTNQTVSVSQEKTNKDKPKPTESPDVHTSAPPQPVKVVISNGCNSSNAKEQELELQPGSPLVMTHRISLLPGGCSGECESELAALVRRVARLEREMSLLKDKCPCSGNCPNDCIGNRKCEAGKCVCHQGFEGADCSKQKTDVKAPTRLEIAGTNSTLSNKHQKDGAEQSETAVKDQTKTGVDELKDQPRSNRTQSNDKRGSDKTGTSPTTSIGTKQPTMSTGSNRTDSTTQKTDKVETKAKSVDNKNKEATETGKDKHEQGINKTSPHEIKVHVTGGSGLGSVKVVNASSNSFTLTWLAPQGMFKNFTVIRTEPQLESEGKEEALEQASRAKNSTEGQVNESKPAKSKGKEDNKRVSITVPGSVRSMEFHNLRTNTRYVLQIYGSAAKRRSKTHRVTAVTGPDPATDIVLSNVTESSLTVSWSKPKTKFTGFRVSYTNMASGERHVVTVGSQQSQVVLSKLSAASTYAISVTTTIGRAQSDALTSVISTVPAPPTHLQVVDVTDSRALLRWTPSPGKVERFIITYEFSKAANVTVTVTLSGTSVEHQLRGLQRGTVYTVRVLSQKGSLQSPVASTTFTTANVVKASEVGPRSAVVMWKTQPSTVYQSYRVTYQVVGEEKKEVTLDPTVTQCKLTGLTPMTRYTVLVQGERDGQYTSLVTAEFLTGKLRFPFPAECSQELLNGAPQSGEVDIYPQGKEGRAARVYCDMETDGGGWTVFQRRMNGKTDFYRNWSDYRAGFGNQSEEFWLGNELLHNLTSVQPVSLRVDMRSGNDTAYAHYANFSVDSEKKHYALTVSGFRGTAGDSMTYHNGRPFSTWDKNPQSLGIHCAKVYTGGWWYKNCYKTNLNGRYSTNSNNQGIVWIDWKGKDFSIPFTELKFRPSNFSPATHG